jgi:hypothetical protein
MFFGVKYAQEPSAAQPLYDSQTLSEFDLPAGRQQHVGVGQASRLSSNSRTVSEGRSSDAGVIARTQAAGMLQLSLDLFVAALAQEDSIKGAVAASSPLRSNTPFVVMSSRTSRRTP